MAWSAPMTAVANATFTAAQFNASVRDNLNETAAAKATATGRMIITTGVNSLAERIPTMDYLGTSEATASTSYAHLGTIGPTAASVTTGTTALVIHSTVCANSTVNAESYAGIDIGGATTTAASDTSAIRLTSATANASVGCSYAAIYTLTAGANNFRIVYRVSSGTGTWSSRRVTVLPF